MTWYTVGCGFIIIVGMTVKVNTGRNLVTEMNLLQVGSCSMKGWNGDGIGRQSGRQFYDGLSTLKL